MDLSKFASRKFIISLAAFLGALGEGLVGFFVGNDFVMACAGISMALSAAFYAGAEAYVDGKAAGSNTTSTSISASTTAKEIVQSAINKEQM